jgi:hypothetical protein
MVGYCGVGSVLSGRWGSGMNADQSIEPGMVYIAPSGRRVEFLGIEAGEHQFRYLGSDEALALSDAIVALLHREIA